MVTLNPFKTNLCTLVKLSNRNTYCGFLFVNSNECKFGKLFNG